MGSIVASVITGRAARQLSDIGFVRWEESELLDWLNEGQGVIVTLRPEAKTAIADLQLVAGTKQELPDDGVRLHKVQRNRGGVIAADGDAITLVDMALLDSYRPGWHQDTPSSEVQHYCHSADDPRVFYVYPPQPETLPGKVEISYSAIPATLTATTETIDIDDIFQGALLDYILYRALSKDSDYAGADRISAGHYQHFLNALGAKSAVDRSVSPQSSSAPHAHSETERR